LRLRPLIAAEAASFSTASTFPLWEAAERLGVVVSLLADVSHAQAIDGLAERFAEVPIVIDHLGHPDTSSAAGLAAFRPLLDLARRPRIYLKLSGFYHFSRREFPFADCWELVRAAYEHFGPQRLLWGSDFPHVVLASSLARSLEVIELALAGLSADDRQSVLGANARRLYWPAPGPPSGRAQGAAEI
jgi:predicted TIM-barrel fold metal-dependent hydrolase